MLENEILKKRKKSFKTYYKSKPKENERWLIKLIEKILEEFPTFAHRRIRIKLKEMGYIYKSSSSVVRYANKQ